MTIQTFIEIIGYLGSFLVIVSMLMTSVVKLRIINTFGCVIFAAYALCIHSYPTAAMQICLIAINIVNLYKLLNVKKDYSAVKVSSSDSFLQHFLKSNSEDIKKYFPDFSAPASEEKTAYLVCGKEASSGVAGVLVCTKAQSGSIHVELDYTTPAYRDCSVGKFLYSYLSSEGITELRAKSSCPAHEKYLQKMGFSQNGDVFVKKI